MKSRCIRSTCNRLGLHVERISGKDYVVIDDLVCFDLNKVLDQIEEFEAFDRQAATARRMTKNGSGGMTNYG